MFIRDDKRFASGSNSRRRFTSYGSSSRGSGSDLFPIVGIVAVAVLVVSGLVFGVYQHTKPGSVSACVVSDKDRTRDSDGNSDMRIYTDNCGTLQVADNLLVGQFDSADVYSSIKVGKTYDFETRGVRIPLLSAFPNIVKVTPAS